MDEFVFWGIPIVVIIAGLGLVWFFNRPKESGLTKSQIKYYKTQITRIERGSSNSEKIISYDKVFAHILKDLGYEGTVGDQLKARPKEIRNIDEVWRLHKIRNRLAHELAEMREGELKKEARNFEKILLDIL